MGRTTEQIASVEAALAQAAEQIGALRQEAEEREGQEHLIGIEIAWGHDLGSAETGWNFSATPRVPAWLDRDDPIGTTLRKGNDLLLGTIGQLDAEEIDALRAGTCAQPLMRRHARARERLAGIELLTYGPSSSPSFFLGRVLDVYLFDGSRDQWPALVSLSGRLSTNHWSVISLAYEALGLGLSCSDRATARMLAVYGTS